MKGLNGSRINLLLVVFFPPTQKLQCVGTKNLDKRCATSQKVSKLGREANHHDNKYLCTADHAIPWICRIPHDARSPLAGTCHGPCNYLLSRVALRSMLMMHNGGHHAMQTGF